MTGDEDEQAARASYRPDHGAISTIGDLVDHKDARIKARLFQIAPSGRLLPETRWAKARAWVARIIRNQRPPQEIAL